jgi:hypothetical protein
MSTMQRMIERGEAAVEAASDQDANALAQMSEEVAHSERQMYLQDAITNIHHYADHYGLSWGDALNELHYQAEKGTPLEEAWG